MMNAIRFVNILRRAWVPPPELPLDCALSLAPAAVDVDTLAQASFGLIV
jgi:hypothetical protein